MKLYTVTYKKYSYSETQNVLIATNTIHAVNEDFKKFAKKNYMSSGEIRSISILHDNIRVAK